MSARTFFALAVLVAGCGEQLPMGTGLVAQLQVRGGRFVEAPFPAGPDADASVAPDPDGGAPLAPPVVAVVQTANLQVRGGQLGKTFNGSVSFNATTVAVGLEADRGYWLVPVDARDVDLPPNLTFHAVADLASDLAPGPRTVLFAAVDAAGRIGPRRGLPLTVLSELPDAPLAVVLDWDRPMDLDLLVALPDGTTLGSRGIRTAAGTWTRVATGGPRVDLNSNAGCVIDGRNREAATFPVPAAGAYTVRVHLFAACDEAGTAWRVRVVRGGAVVSEARGQSFARDVDAPGGGPAEDGRRVLDFSVAE